MNLYNEHICSTTMYGPKVYISSVVGTEVQFISNSLRSLSANSIAKMSCSSSSKAIVSSTPN